MAAIETGVSITALSCWCATRDAKLVRVNGVARGSILQSDNTTLWQLGIDAPVAAPTIADDATASTIFAATYYCAYRFVDSNGQPSSLSPITTFAATAKHSFDWSGISSSSQSSTHGVTTTQYFRSLAGDPSVLYQVSLSFSGGHATDSVSDDSLLGAAIILPVLNDDGTLNANRFVPPPQDRAVAVPYADRYWYGVGGSGVAEWNRVYYSAIDEIESVPTQNAIDIVTAAGATDAMTAMIPYASALWIMYERHAYRLRTVADPAIDGSVRLAASRGAISQRSWIILHDVLYVMDEQGAYAIDGDGYRDLAKNNADWWVDGTIDMTKRALFFCSIEPVWKYVRFHVVRAADTDSNRCDTALCYDPDTDAWWWETYLGGLLGCTVVDTGTQLRSLTGGTTGQLMLMGDEFAADQFFSAPAGAVSCTGQNGYAASNYECSYKTGIAQIPRRQDKDDDGKRQITIVFVPSTATTWLYVEIFYDHRTTGETMKIPQRNNSVITTLNSDKIGYALTRSDSLYSENPGLLRYQFEARAEQRAATRHFIAARLSFTTAGERINISSVDIEGAAATDPSGEA